MSFLAKLLLLAAMFSLGFVTSAIFDSQMRYALSDTALSVVSPADKIRPEDVKVYPDRTVIDREGIIWAKIKDTHSMEPVLNSDSISLELKPLSPKDISVGDIITYAKDKLIIIHRVIEVGNDDYGWYAVTRGDNNHESDPWKVRFDQVNGIVVGILY